MMIELRRRQGVGCETHQHPHSHPPTTTSPSKLKPPPLVNMYGNFELPMITRNCLAFCPPQPQNKHQQHRSDTIYSKFLGWVFLVFVLSIFFWINADHYIDQNPSSLGVDEFQRSGLPASKTSFMHSHESRKMSHTHRVAQFVYLGENDVHRMKSMKKILQFHKKWNISDDRLPQYAMITSESRLQLESSRDYRYQLNSDEPDECEPQYSWQSDVYPTCNTLHEFADLTTLEKTNGLRVEIPTKIIANGYWRDVWILSDDHGVRVAKTLRYEHKLTMRNYDRNRRDAMALEHLTSSNYVVDIYGYCSIAGLFEYSDGGDITAAIWPQAHDNSTTIKHLTPISKLQIATQGAMALAVTHNFDKEGQSSIAHTDIGLDQFIMINGRFKLNDFNRARFLLKYKSNGTSCPYFVGKNIGKNRSPEEYAYGPQTEKVDVYSFGNIIYSLLQEELPFADTKKKEVPKAVMEGIRPSVFYDIWNSTDPIIQSLKDAMIMCHEGDPHIRASAREVETFLKSKLEEFDPGRLKSWGDI